MPCTVPVCRGCLCGAAERKLLDIHQGELDQLYQDIMRFTEPVCDDLPPYMCIYCTALLLKCVDFKRRCEKAREVLDCLLLSANTKVTRDHINIINRSSKKLTIPLTIDRSAYTIECTDTYVEVKEEEEGESVKEEKAVDMLSHETDRGIDVADDIKNLEHLFVVIDNIKNGSEEIAEIKAEDQTENKKKKIKDKLTKERKLNRENEKISKDEKEVEKTESRINKRKKKTCLKTESRTTEISKVTDKGDSSGEAELKQTIKEFCSDSDIDDIMLSDISQVTAKESKSESKNIGENEEQTNNVNCDEHTDVDQIFKGICNDNETNTVINDISKHNNKSKKKNEGNNKGKSKEKKQKKREYIPMMDEATFSKQFHMAVVFLTEKEQRDEFEARKNSKSYIDAPYKCNKCFRGWHRVGPLNIHMEKHDPKSGRLRCDICGYHYRSMENYQRHRLSHRYKLVCQQCGFETYSRHYARLHYRRHMGHTFTCAHCGAVFTSQSGQLAHARVFHPAEHAPCGRCGEAFLGVRGLRAHLARSAGRCGPAASASGSSESSEHSCPLCSKRFMSAASLEVHRQRVHLNIRFRDVRPTSEAKNLTTHICEICGKGFNAKTKLAHHQMKHEGHKPFHCSHCPKTFMSKNSLLTHIRSHSGEKPFQCTLCGRAFASQSSHWRHKMMHKEKRYKCDICDKLFTQSGSVKLHVRTVHMKLPAPRRVRGRGKSGKEGKGSESGADDLTGAMQVDPTVD